ncbi:hypothetical protein BK123_32205 [Paenibacillus lautus]|uniref:Uncharacterized protein n=1 Tax=Paenibacillus lautus TaxID=1401 RepID=A0A1R1AN70_PAELA|nr:hypothetical protein BK123_32205 [Paenibacillus lautus]
MDGYKGHEDVPAGEDRAVAGHKHKPHSDPRTNSEHQSSGCPEGSALGALPGREGLGGWTT